MLASEKLRLFRLKRFNVKPKYSVGEAKGMLIYLWTSCTAALILEDSSILSSEADDQANAMHIHEGLSEKGTGISYIRPLSEYAENKIKTVEKDRIKIDEDNINQAITNEMQELSPEVHEKIYKSIKNSNVDRSRYRDIFLIKKRIISQGDKKIVSFDIKERAIPRSQSILISRDPLIKGLFLIIVVLLLALIFATTVKMHQHLIQTPSKLNTKGYII
ncbi:hypothetical protein ENBRE01_1256 [Enteropsectra breve]|nr:hypothetical protein ENBRE01_1256 [Enteropsectra breve]